MTQATGVGAGGALETSLAAAKSCPKSGKFHPRATPHNGRRPQMPEPNHRPSLPAAGLPPARGLPRQSAPSATASHPGKRKNTGQAWKDAQGGWWPADEGAMSLL
jgi:hypothetical protein